jgi:putative iron-dependent peroxidase
MSTPQAGILAAVPNLSRYLEFSSVPDTDLAAVVGGLASRKLAEDVVIGIGPSLVQGLKGSIELLRTFPSLSGPGCEVPSTQADIWCWIKGDDRGEIAARLRTSCNPHSDAAASSTVSVMTGDET